MTSNEPQSPSGPHPERPTAALHAVLLLNCLAEGDSSGVSIREAAEYTGTSRSAAHRALQALGKAGFTIQEDSGHYTIGPGLVRLSALVVSRSSFLNAADAVMARLVQEVGETSYLAMHLPGERFATFIHRVECDNPLRYVQPIGSKLPLHAGAIGKAVLANVEDVELEAALEVFTDATLTGEQLQEDLTHVRERGYAMSIEERVKGAAGVAAPVWGPDRVFGALTVNIPTSRLPAGGLEQLGPVVTQYARELSVLVSANYRTLRD